jgi:hypothetical protein
MRPCLSAFYAHLQLAALRYYASLQLRLGHIVAFLVVLLAGGFRSLRRLSILNCQNTDTGLSTQEDQAGHTTLTELQITLHERSTLFSFDPLACPRISHEIQN